MFDSFWSKTVLRIATYKVCGTASFSFKIIPEIVSVCAKNMGKSGKGKSVPLQTRCAQRVPRVKVPRLRDNRS